MTTICLCKRHNMATVVGPSESCDVCELARAELVSAAHRILAGHYRTVGEALCAAAERALREETLSDEAHELLQDAVVAWWTAIQPADSGGEGQDK